MSVRKKFSPDLKTQVVLEILREEKTMAQISSEYGIHPTQLKQWKKIVLEGIPTLFENEQKAINTMRKEYEKTISELHEQIGELTMQLAWLKKKCGHVLTKGGTPRSY